MRPDLLCHSHLRWDYVFQRPNHLMTRAARDRRVFYVEEPVKDPPGSADIGPRLEARSHGRLLVVVPHVPESASPVEQEGMVRRLLGDFYRRQGVRRPVVWLTTPMALPLVEDLDRSALVYDCMDHLGAFLEAPADLPAREERLLRAADLVFTGGQSLYRRLETRHRQAYCYPSSVDVAHFIRARDGLVDPDDQAAIARPRFGYAGVIDERLDMDLIRALAERQPETQIVLLGPVSKIDPATIPVAPNIHALGMRDYAQLPAYLSGWDVGIMPFARNEATRYISPTKTPEYLAAGLPVASTSIHDVVVPYQERGLVEIGDGPDGFLDACRRAAALSLVEHRSRADAHLRSMSWDRTWAAMEAHIEGVVEAHRPVRPTIHLPLPVDHRRATDSLSSSTAASRSVGAAE